MRNSIAYRGAIVWNALAPSINDTERECNPKTFSRLIKTAGALKCIEFEATSAQTAPLRDDVFKTLFEFFNNYRYFFFI